MKPMQTHWRQWNDSRLQGERLWILVPSHVQLCKFVSFRFTDRVRTSSLNVIDINLQIPQVSRC